VDSETCANRLSAYILGVAHRNAGGIGRGGIDWFDQCGGKSGRLYPTLCDRLFANHNEFFHTGTAVFIGFNASKRSDRLDGESSLRRNEIALHFLYSVCMSFAASGVLTAAPDSRDSKIISTSARRAVV
jgi:hypothetical protein